MGQCTGDAVVRLLSLLGCLGMDWSWLLVLGGRGVNGPLSGGVQVFRRDGDGSGSRWAV